jgi:hypothetical protein
MKKFGTPIGAGPGSESEYVGFVALGTPLPEGSFGEAVFFFSVAPWCLPFFFVELFSEPPPWLEAFSGDDEVGDAVVLVVDVVVCECEAEVEVELDVVVVDDELDDELLEVPELVELLEVGVDVVVVVVVDVGLVAVVHVIVSDTIAIPVGSGSVSCDGGVAGGASTLKVSVCPSISFTVTVHGSAAASEIAKTARPKRKTAVAAKSADSRRLMIKPRLPLLPTFARASHHVETDRTVRLADGTLLTGPEVCN